MPKTDVKFDSSVIGRISFEMQYIFAQGGPEFPKLVFTLDLRLSAFKNATEVGQPVQPLTWMFLSGEFSSPEQRAVAHFRHDVNMYAADIASPRETQFRLEIPLDPVTIERIEQSREGDLRAALTFEAFFAVHVLGGYGVQRFETARIESIVFSVPKSQWVEKLLPQLGYGRLELIEVRFSDGIRAQGLPKAVEEIRLARQSLTEGEWEVAVGRCRNALEAIPDSRPLQLPPASKFGSKVNTFVNDHLGAKLGDEKAKLIADELNLLWAVCSKAAHSSPPDFFKRADAEFIVRNTTAILEYVGRLLT